MQQQTVGRETPPLIWIICCDCSICGIYAVKKQNPNPKIKIRKDATI